MLPQQAIDAKDAVEAQDTKSLVSKFQLDNLRAERPGKPHP